MYLRELFVKNSGPLRELHVNFAFASDGSPIPHLIVGRNGTGKTNLLSLIADALMEGASNVYTDILGMSGMSRNYFRLVGGSTLTYDESGGFSALRFEHKGQPYFYREIVGSVTSSEAQQLAPSTLGPAVTWADTERNSKGFPIPEEIVRSAYEQGSNVFFPASRSEIPHWLNRDTMTDDVFNTSDRFNKALNKPIYVEHGIDKFVQWLLGVLTESRAVIGLVADPNNPGQMTLGISDGLVYGQANNMLSFANRMLRAIVDDDQASFYWAGRHQPRKIGVVSGGRKIAVGLDSLSGGQATLLSLFGTVLMYGDAAGIEPQALEGIVVVDELDAHMHIDLQRRALPELIALFPRIQFITSCHSPFFALGMEKIFPEGGVRIIELPTGMVVDAEAYEEFENALDALRDTRTFEEKLRVSLTNEEQPIIWLAGETDVPYFKTAAKLLGFSYLEDYFQWIGATGESGSGTNTGDNGLKAVVKFLKANPDFTSRRIAIVYDHDANQINEHFGSIDTIGIQKIEGAVAEKGIENLLPPEAFIESDFKINKVPSGIKDQPKIIPEIRKRVLCDRLCGPEADQKNFVNFRPVLERIAAVLPPPEGQGMTEPSGGAPTGQ